MSEPILVSGCRIPSLQLRPSNSWGTPKDDALNGLSATKSATAVTSHCFFAELATAPGMLCSLYDPLEPQTTGQKRLPIAREEDLDAVLQECLRMGKIPLSGNVTVDVSISKETFVLVVSCDELFTRFLMQSRVASRGCSPPQPSFLHSSGTRCFTNHQGATTSNFSLTNGVLQRLRSDARNDAAKSSTFSTLTRVVTPQRRMNTVTTKRNQTCQRQRHLRSPRHSLHRGLHPNKPIHPGSAPMCAVPLRRMATSTWLRGLVPRSGGRCGTARCGKPRR